MISDARGVIIKYIDEITLPFDVWVRKMSMHEVEVIEEYNIDTLKAIDQPKLIII
jgi:hypothetical protein